MTKKESPFLEKLRRYYSGLIKDFKDFITREKYKTLKEENGELRLKDIGLEKYCRNLICQCSSYRQQLQSEQNLYHRNTGELEEQLNELENKIHLQELKSEKQSDLIAYLRGNRKKISLEIVKQCAKIVDQGVIIGVIDPQDRIVYINDTFTEEYGFSKEEILGRDYTEFLEGDPETIRYFFNNPEKQEAIKVKVKRKNEKAREREIKKYPIMVPFKGIHRKKEGTDIQVHLYTLFSLKPAGFRKILGLFGSKHGEELYKILEKHEKELEAEEIEKARKEVLEITKDHPGIVSHFFPKINPESA